MLQLRADDVFKIRNKAQFVDVKAANIELFLIVIIVSRDGGAAVVDLHVISEVPGGGERPGTLLAGVRLLLDVGHSVIVEVGGGRETFPTYLAHMRLLSCVNPPVCVETGAGGESFITEVTHVGSLSCVSSDVSLQQAGPVELLATGITGK